MAELTTVADDEAVVHDGTEVRVHDGLEPGTTYSLDEHDFRTLPDLGERLATFATVNDVHFGETECGAMEGFEVGEVFSSEEGEDPYYEVMNRSAISEMSAIDPEVVVVKGDLTTRGTLEEYQLFLDAYEPAFGDRLVHVRGNHDGYYGENYASEPTQRIDLAGVTLAVVDTTNPLHTPGRLTGEQLEWLDQLGTEADRPVLVFGHHHPWDPASNSRPEQYFGINCDDSEALVEVIARRSALRGYFAGHTHRNRVRRFSASGDVPYVEVACVKDFPGTWAEYRVFEQGILQIHRRISTPEALAWSEKTRAMFGGLYPGYAFGELDDRCFAIRAEPRSD